MLQSKSKRRTNAGINAGSMADIAFLLLIFFLVTTTILQDEGIMVRLPPFEEESPKTDMRDRNVLVVKLNGANELLVEGDRMPVARLRTQTKEFVENPQQLRHLSSSPAKAVVSFQCDRSTNYEHYLEVYNELKAAYRELWEEKALQFHGMEYNKLLKTQQKAIRNQFPMTISEADPFDAAQL